MNRILFNTALLLFTLHTPAMSEEQDLPPELLEEIESKALRPYFNALKSGNMELIMRYTTGGKREKFQRRVDRSKDYSRSLREFYRDAVFSVKDGVFTEDGVIVSVHVEMPEETLGYRFKLQKRQRNNGGQQTGVGSWLITEEPNYQAE